MNQVYYTRIVAIYLIDFSFQLTVLVKFNVQGSECGQNVFDRRINLCKMVASFVNNPFLSVIFKNLNNSSNFAMSCPFAPGLYEIKNLAIEIPSALSTPLLMASMKGYCAEIKTSGVVKGEKTVNDFLYFGGRGHLIE